MSLCMDASAGSSPPHSQENPSEHGGGRGDEQAEEIGGEAADDFIFADDTFPTLPDFPCLSSPSSSTYSSSSSSNSSSAYTNAGGGVGGGGADGAAGEPSGPASVGEGFDALEDIDQILDFASLSVPWDSEPLFPDVGMMIEPEDAMTSSPPHLVGDVPNGRGQGKALLEGTGGDEACMDAAAGDDLPRFFMEWLTNNRESISAEDLRGIRLRRSTIEAAAARLGGGRQGTLQLLKLILTWVQNHHLQKKRSRGAMEAAAEGSHGQGQLLCSPGVNSGYEFPAGGHDTAAAAGTSWVSYQQSFTQPAYGGESTVYPTSGAGQQYTFHQQSCGTSSVVVNSQPFSPPAVSDMHTARGGNISWPPQYVQFPGAPTGSYPMPPPRVFPQPFSSGFAGQYTMGSQQRMAGVEASATKEARKKRMARQRRLSCLQQQRSQQLSPGQQIQSTTVLQQEPSPHQAAHSAPVTPSMGGWGFCPPSGHQQIRNPLSTSDPSTPMLQMPSPEAASPPPAKPASSARQGESPQRAAASDKRQSGAKADKNLRFLLQKVLKQSDVGSLGRIVLPKKEAETHLPELKTRDGVSIPMEDIGTSRVWNMRYRFWPNNKSRMYLLENTGEFVRSNELQEGDFIVIYSDVKSGKYVMFPAFCSQFTVPFSNLLLIRGVKVRPALEQGGNGLGKQGHGCPEGAAGGASGSRDGGGVDGACISSRPPHGAVRRARPEESAPTGQMPAMSI